MLNIFYTYSLIWIAILVLYSFGWSDLCTQLDTKLLIFLIISIILSLIIGKIVSNKFKFIKLEQNPHKTKGTTLFLIIFYILDFIYAKKIPILHVLAGNSYAAVNFNGIPTLHVLLSAFAIFYSTYLAYIFICFKEKKVLIEYILTISFFLLLVQRQNIFVCIMLFFNILWASKKNEFNRKTKNKKGKYLILFVVFLSIALYGFGIIGNMRYGSKWDWNDSSMICKLGKISNKYPKVLPKEYFWSYLYLTSPLSNLNANIKNVNGNDNTTYFLMEFVPEVIRNNVFSSYEKKEVLLPVKSLNASTSFVRVYNYFGYAGMYAMSIFQLMISLVIIVITYKNQKKYFNVVCNILMYFLVFSFFENTVVYSTTSLLVIYSLFCNIKIKKINKENKVYRQNL